MDFSLFFFANHEGADDQKYSLITEASQWADTHDFVAVWLPERHFHAFGGLSPNPSVVAAALSTITDNVQLRSGSVVTPLHDPIRIVEEWSAVDNLSNGRVGLGVACGWVPNDFVISGNQESFATRKDVFAQSIDTIANWASMYSPICWGIALRHWVTKLPFIVRHGKKPGTRGEAPCH